MQTTSLHSIAATHDIYKVVKQPSGIYQLVHKNTGRVDATHSDVIAFCSTLRTRHQMPQRRVSHLIRNAVRED